MGSEINSTAPNPSLIGTIRSVWRWPAFGIARPSDRHHKGVGTRSANHTQLPKRAVFVHRGTHLCFFIDIEVVLASERLRKRKPPRLS
eukprot:scaffold2578_cov230-Pinguiococcus_pyrenoidosus.AAC.1